MMTLNIDAVTVGLVAFIAGVGQEFAKELFSWFRHYREKASKFLSDNNIQKPMK